MSKCINLNLITILVQESEIMVTETCDCGWTDLNATLKMLFSKVSKSASDYQKFKLEDFVQIGETFELYYSTIIPDIAKRDEIAWKSMGDIKSDIVKKALISI